MTRFKKTFQKLVNSGIVLYEGDVAVKEDIRYYPLFLLEWLLG